MLVISDNFWQFLMISGKLKNKTAVCRLVTILLLVKSRTVNTKPPLRQTSLAGNTPVMKMYFELEVC